MRQNIFAVSVALLLVVSSAAFAQSSSWFSNLFGNKNTPETTQAMPVMPSNSFIFGDDVETLVETEYLVDDNALFPILDKDFSAEIIIIDKRLGESKTYKAVKDLAIEHGRISVTLRRCTEEHEGIADHNAAWVEVHDQQFKEIFSGWMFSKLPGATALEHPEYDVILKSCHLS